MVERREKTSKPCKIQVSTSVDEDLVAENQRLKERVEYLEMENEYLKKLRALIQAEEEKSRSKKPR